MASSPPSDKISVQVRASGFHCNFSLAYLGDKEKTFDSSKLKYAIREAADSIHIPSGELLHSRELLWGVSKSKKWAVLFTYVYNSNPVHLSYLVCHGVQHVRDMVRHMSIDSLLSKLPKESWSSRATNYWGDGGYIYKIKPIEGEIVCSSVFVWNRCSPPLAGDISELCSAIMVDSVLKVARDLSACNFYPANPDKSRSLYVVFILKKILSTTSSSESSCHHPEYSFGRIGEKKLTMEINEWIGKLRVYASISSPINFHPLVITEETSQIKNEEKETSLDKCREKLRVSKVALAEMEAAVSRMEDETKKVQDKVKELEYELSAKTLLKDGLDMKRKELEDKLSKEKICSTETMKPSTSTPTLFQKHVGIRGLLDSRTSSHLTTRTLEPITSKSPSSASARTGSTQSLPHKDTVTNND